jgi:sporulation protein YlmC with PRC-barrel domain
MRKLTFLFSTLVVISLILSACAPASETGEPTPGFGVTPDTIDTPDIVPEVTPELTPEITPEITLEVTPEETMEVTPEGTQEATPEGTPVGEAFLDTNPTMASDLIGLGVRNAEGENLGEIEELVVDRGNGDIHYAVVGAGGFLGLGERLILVPFTALDVDPMAEEVDQLVHLNVDQQVLTDAPNFEDIPDVTASDWDADVRTYWEAHVDVLPVTGPEGQPVSAIRISDPTDIDIQNTAGEDIGDIENMVLDLGAGRISYLILATGGVLDLGECLLPVSWTALETSTDDDLGAEGTPAATPVVEATPAAGATPGTTPAAGEEAILEEDDLVFVLDTDAHDLSTAPCFASMDEFPETREPDWDAEIRNFWGDVTS